MRIPTLFWTRVLGKFRRYVYRMKARGEAIRLQDSISVVTSFGEHVVELCYGDITKLPVEEKMDIIMVSAFIGRSIP